MTDQFDAQLQHLLHIARERIDLIDSATNHAMALAERYQQLRDAIDGCEGVKAEVEERLRAILGRPNYDDPPIMENFSQRRVA